MDQAGLTEWAVGGQNPRLRALVERLAALVADAGRKHLTGKATVELHFREGEFVRAALTLPETIE